MAEAKRAVDQLLGLSRDERSAAAEALLANLEDDEHDEHVERAWAEEIQRRVAENGPGVPADEVFADGRTRLLNHP